MTALHRNDPRGLRHALADQLKRRIAQGDLGAGDRVPSEAELCHDFAVSRTVVREAVAQLRAEGLVETFRGRGCSYVIAPNGGQGAGAGLSPAGSPRQIMELRLALECEASSLAASRRSAVDLAAIGRAMTDLREVLSRREPAIAQDFAVHLAIAVAAGNPPITGVLRELGPQAILRHRTGIDGSVVMAPGHAELLVHEHQQICDAIARGDPETARAAMRTHLSRSLAALDTGPSAPPRQRPRAGSSPGVRSSAHRPPGHDEPDRPL